MKVNDLMDPQQSFFQEQLWDCRMIESVPTADFAAVMSDDQGKKSLTLSLTAVGHFGHTLLEMKNTLKILKAGKC